MKDDKTKGGGSISNSPKKKGPQTTTNRKHISELEEMELKKTKWSSSPKPATRSPSSNTKKQVQFPTTTPATPNRSGSESRSVRKSRYSPTPGSKEEVLKPPLVVSPSASSTTSEDRASRKSRLTSLSPNKSRSIPLSPAVSSAITEGEGLPESPLQLSPRQTAASEIRARRKSRLSTSIGSSGDAAAATVAGQTTASDIRTRRKSRLSTSIGSSGDAAAGLESSLASRTSPKSPQKSKNMSNLGRSSNVLPQPGAVRVESNIIGETSAAEGDNEHHDRDSITRDEENPNPRLAVEEEIVIAAVPVDRAKEERDMEERLKEQQAKSMVQAEKVEQEIPWFKRKSFLAFGCCMVLALIAAIVVIVLLATNDSSTTLTTTTTTRTNIPTTISIVLQLDSKPAETGWMLECDGETIVEAKPGTYTLLAAYAVATGAIPYYRLEYQADVFIRSTCQLTLSDTAGNGLDGGLYEVYYGDYVGNRNTNLLSGGTFTSSSTTIEFVVEEVKKSTPNNEASIDDSPPHPDDIGCTICPDGSPVSYDNTIVPYDGALTGNLTCSDLDVVSRNTILDDGDECSAVQDTAPLCGCTNYCTTICPDGSSQPNPSFGDNLLFIDEDQNQVTCSALQADLQNSNTSTSEIQCLTAHLFGEDVCGCPKTTETGFCRICQGDTNPPAEALESEILPGFRCNDLMGLGYTLRPPAGWYFRFCPSCVGVGAYCGCDQPPDGQQFCRLCGNNNNDLLPEPARIVNSTILNEVTTCFHVEFAANANETAGFPSCEVFQQETSEYCCS